MTYSVRRTVNGTVTITDGLGNNRREEAATTAMIYEDGHFVTSARLNASFMGRVYGMDATDEQIIRAVL
jgi:hypothetical protein